MDEILIIVTYVLLCSLSKAILPHRAGFGIGRSDFLFSVVYLYILVSSNFSSVFLIDLYLIAQ